MPSRTSQSGGTCFFSFASGTANSPAHQQRGDDLPFPSSRSLRAHLSCRASASWTQRSLIVSLQEQRGDPPFTEDLNPLFWNIHRRGLATTVPDRIRGDESAASRGRSRPLDGSVHGLEAMIYRGEGYVRLLERRGGVPVSGLSQLGAGKEQVIGDLAKAIPRGVPPEEVLPRANPMVT